MPLDSSIFLRCELICCSEKSKPVNVTAKVRSIKFTSSPFIAEILLTWLVFVGGLFILFILNVSYSYLICGI